MIHKLQPFFAQAVSNNVLRMLSAEVAKILSLNNHAFRSPALDFMGSKPTARNPAFNSLRVNMECYGQGVFGKAVFAHLGVAPESVQHVPDRAARTAH